MNTPWSFVQVIFAALIQLRFPCPPKTAWGKTVLRAAVRAALVCMSFELSFSAYGQVAAPTIPDNGPTTTSPLGIPPHSSSSGTNESVSMMNGSLNVYIPLLSLPQRGGYNLSLGLVHKSNPYVLEQATNIQSLLYNQSGQMLDIDHITYADSVVSHDGSLEINLPRLQFSYEYVGNYLIYASGEISQIENIFCATNFQFTDWSGNKHPFENLAPCNGPPPSVSQQTLTDSSDGSFYRLDTSTPTDMKVYSPDGAVYHFTGFSDPCPIKAGTFYPCTTQENYYDQRASLIVDPNGNQIATTLTFVSDAPVYTLADTLGRTVTIADSGVSYMDSNGTPQTITISGQASTEFSPIQPTLSCSYAGTQQSSPYVTPTLAHPPYPSGNPGTVTITFPASAGSGQKQYILQFDGINRLAKIQYPYGGYTRYDYQEADTTRVMSNVRCTVFGSQVAHKYECTSSNSSSCSEQTTTYTPTVDFDQVQNVTYNQKMIVKDPLGDIEEHDFSTSNPIRTNPLETDVYIEQPNGALLEHTHSVYPTGVQPTGPQDSFDYNFPTTVTKSLYNPSNSSQSVSSTTSYTYEPYTSTFGAGVIDQPIEIDTTNYSGAVIQKVSQQWEPASAFTSSPHILNRMQSRTTTDAAASVSSSVTYGYNTAGNITSKTVAGTGVSSLLTQYPRNAYGEITSIIDPKNLTTTIGYADAWSSASPSCVSANSSAYPTSIKNAAGQTTSYTYNACTGTIATVTDPNGVIDNYTYDALGRVLCETVTGANSIVAAKKCNTFVDSAPSTFTESVAQSSSTNISTSTTLDGFGRAIETSLTSDPSGADLTDTTYDANGRVQSVSNPYRSLSDPTYGVTSYAYDAMGRKIYQCQPDNSSSTSSECTPQNDYEAWSYNQNTVTFQDENGNQWQQTKDALGRLTKVLEPNGSAQAPSMETDYTYDALANLRSVAQCGGPCPSSHSVTRSFTYNGLSQLLTAFNPETGTVCYGVWSSSNCINGYDADGNLQYRTDARGIVTTYSYDNLNRLLSKRYSSDATGTQTSCFQYDLSSIPYAIGRLTNQWTQSASGGACASSPPSSGMWTKRAILAYDALGHVLNEQQCTPATCSAGTPYASSYSYDMAGNTLTSTNGITSTPTVGTLSFTNTFDAAGHLSTVASNWSDSAHPAGLFSAQSALSQTLQCPQSITSAPYAAFGGLMNATFGSGITLSRSYDIRQRISCEMDTGSPTP